MIGFILRMCLIEFVLSITIKLPAMDLCAPAELPAECDYYSRGRIIDGAEKDVCTRAIRVLVCELRGDGNWTSSCLVGTSMGSILARGFLLHLFRQHHRTTGLV